MDDSLSIDTRTAARRPFLAPLTAICLAAWVALVALNTLAQELVDPVDSFEHPLDVLVGATETLLEYGSAAERNAQDLPFDLTDPSASWPPYVDSYDALAKLPDGERLATEAATRAAVLRVEAFGVEDGVDPVDVLELDLPDPLPDSLRAVRAAYAGASSDDLDALEAAALDLRPGWARTRLLERWRDEVRATPEVEAAIESAVRTAEERSLAFAAMLTAALLAGLAGALAFAALVVMPTRTVRLDPAHAQQSWPPLPSGLGLFARYGVSFMAMSVVVAAIGGVTGGTKAALGVSGLLTSAPLLLFAWRHWRDRSLGRRELGLVLRPSAIPMWVFYALGGWVAAALSTITMGILQSSVTGTPDPFANPFLDIIADPDTSIRPRLLLEACLWAPIFEELGFRAALFGGLRSRMGFLPAALISSVAFGVVHPYDPFGLLTISLVGFSLAIVYERTRSILTCILAHAIFNFVQLQFAFALYG